MNRVNSEIALFKRGVDFFLNQIAPAENIKYCIGLCAYVLIAYLTRQYLYLFYAIIPIFIYVALTLRP